MKNSQYALSLKQPWATLLAHGRKTIEVRSWSPNRRGRILIHASRIPDPRPEVWKHVPAELWQLSQMNGGIVGEGELLGCVEYRSLDAFAADQGRHLNDPAWFRGRKLYGFLFANAKPLPFRAYPGWMRFFRVEQDIPDRCRQ